MSIPAQSLENKVSSIPEGGEAMLLTFQQHPDMRLYRPVIFIGEMDDPESSELVLGKWSHSMRKANAAGLTMYFETYRSRYGYHHPQDPRKPKDEHFPGVVLSGTFQ